MEQHYISSKYLDIPLQFNASDMEKELSVLSSIDWVSHVNQKVYSGKWSVLPLRTTVNNVDAHPILQSFQIEVGKDWCDLPLLSSLPQVSRLVAGIQCNLKSVRLMKLNPGACISTHRDKGLCAEYGEARLHIPLQTNDDVIFISDGHPLPMKAGELWYVSAHLPHSVENQGQKSRINLVIDVEVNEWLSALLERKH